MNLADFKIEPVAGSVEVRCGVFAGTYPVAGRTVADVHTVLAERMNIDPAASALLDGNAVGPKTVLAEGQVLCFVRPACHKCGRIGPPARRRPNAVTPYAVQSRR